MKKIFLVIALTFLIILGLGLMVRSQMIFSLGKNREQQILTIEKGEGARLVGKKLSSAQIISHSWLWDFYVLTHGFSGKILPGKYSLSGQMTIPEIAVLVTSVPKGICQSNNAVSVLFPEGISVKEMAKILSEKGLDGEGFLSAAQKPKMEWKNQFSFLGSLKDGASLEGYLFPDTYCFLQNASGEAMVEKMLQNFDHKLTLELKDAIQSQKKSLNQVLTMASIIEDEVRSEADRKIVSGLFWNRLKNGQALQSCATIAYVLGEKKNQYTFADTRKVSPYNTYLNVGLPPGPINNPGLSAIRAAIFPEDSVYNYFLTDPETGRTIFSRTIDEHNANKVKYGL